VASDVAVAYHHRNDVDGTATPEQPRPGSLLRNGIRPGGLFESSLEVCFISRAVFMYPFTKKIWTGPLGLSGPTSAHSRFLVRFTMQLFF
jgi:hypothetical protein